MRIKGKPTLSDFLTRTVTQKDCMGVTFQLILDPLNRRASGLDTIGTFFPFCVVLAFDFVSVFLECFQKSSVECRFLEKKFPYNKVSFQPGHFYKFHPLASTASTASDFWGRPPPHVQSKNGGDIHFLKKKSWGRHSPGGDIHLF